MLCKRSENINSSKNAEKATFATEVINNGRTLPVTLTVYVFALATLAVTPARFALKAYSVLNDKLGLTASYLTMARISHVLAFAVLAVLVLALLVHRPFKAASALVASTFIFEGTQVWVPTRSATVEDLSMNLLGIFLGSGVAAIYLILGHGRIKGQ